MNTRSLGQKDTQPNSRLHSALRYQSHFLHRIYVLSLCRWLDSCCLDRYWFAYCYGSLMSVTKRIQAALSLSITRITLQDLRLSQHLICIIRALEEFWMVPTILYFGCEQISLIETCLGEIRCVYDDFDHVVYFVTFSSDEQWMIIAIFRCHKWVHKAEVPFR